MGLFKFIFGIIFMTIFGALGALLFAVYLLPYMLSNSYFQNYQFVKDFKEGKIVVNKTEQVYIQQDGAIEGAIKRIKPSVVVVQTPAGGFASGLITTSDGNIVTLASVVGQSGKVFLQGEAVNYTLVKSDKKNNIALLKIDKNNLQTVSFADVGKIALGQKVFLAAPTSSKMDNWFADEGIVKEIDLGVIKTNIVEKPVVLGSPLFNSAGELMGLNVIDSDGRVFAVSVDTIKTLLGL